MENLFKKLLLSVFVFIGMYLIFGNQFKEEGRNIGRDLKRVDRSIKDDFSKYR